MEWQARIPGTSVKRGGEAGHAVARHHILGLPAPAPGRLHPRRARRLGRLFRGPALEGALCIRQTRNCRGARTGPPSARRLPAGSVTSVSQTCRHGASRISILPAGGQYPKPVAQLATEEADGSTSPAAALGKRLRRLNEVAIIPSQKWQDLEVSQQNSRPVGSFPESTISGAVRQSTILLWIMLKMLTCPRMAFVVLRSRVTR